MHRRPSLELSYVGAKLGGMEELLDEVEPLIMALNQPALYGLTDLQIPTVLTRVQALVAMLTALSAGLVAEATGRGVPAQLGYRSTQTWLREAAHLSGHHARQLVTLGQVTVEHPVVGAAVSAGVVTVDQAVTIGPTLSDLASRVDPTIVAAAAECLLDCAATLGPEQLAIAGQRVLSHVAPEIAEEADADALRRIEERARINRGLALTPDRANQRVRIVGWLTPEQGAVFTAALEPFAVKRPRLDAVDVDDRTPAQRRADALEEISRLVLCTDKLPGNGTDRPHLAVTVDFDALAKRLSYGMLDNGLAVTPDTVRRLACDARILPAVMDTAGQVLDLGRTQRVWTGAARRAVILRDRGCIFPDCDKPPAWCDVHHINYYSHGGGTDLCNAALLCAFHHYLIHHSDWHITMAGDGMPEVIPPAWLDPMQRPRRNAYHRRP